MTVNEELLNNAVSHAVYLEHLKGGISAKMGLLLGELTTDLVRQIKKIVGGDPTKAAWTLAYKKAMLRAVKDITAEWNVSMQQNFEALWSRCMVRVRAVCPLPLQLRGGLVVFFHGLHHIPQ